MSKPAVAYTTEQMVQILKMHELNAFNVSKTSKESGVSRPTLRRWVESMGPEVFNHNNVQEIVFKVDEQVIDRKTKLANRVMDAKEKMLERIIKRIPSTKDMDSLTRGMKILNELDKIVIDPDKGGDTTINNNTFVQYIMDQRKLSSNATKDN